jgi:GTP-binding protein
MSELIAGIDPEKLFAGTCDFVLGVADLVQLPDSDRPEVAFAGRSNVGKSSLINALTGRKNLARTSNTPGRTQQLNFFDLGGIFYLVDLPGYGYAKVSKAQKNDWNKVLRNYLRGRANLRCVFVLVDGRHGIKENDIEIMKMLDEVAAPYRVILTKTDKVKDEVLRERKEKTEELLKKHPAAYPQIMFTSAEKRYGLNELQEQVVRVIVGQ